VLANPVVEGLRHAPNLGGNGLNGGIRPANPS
jgi:hypothetical protein